MLLSPLGKIDTVGESVSLYDNTYTAICDTRFTGCTFAIGPSGIPSTYILPYGDLYDDTFFYEEPISFSTWTIDNELESTDLLIQTYDTNNNIMYPKSINFLGTDVIKINWFGPVRGSAYFAGMKNQGNISTVYFNTSGSSAWDVTHTDSPSGIVYQIYSWNNITINGGFDADTGWTKSDAAITIADGCVSWSGAQTGYAECYQPPKDPFIVNTVYKVVYTILNYAAGSVKVYIGAGLSETSESGPIRSADGTYTEYLTYTNTNYTQLRIQGSSDFQGSIDNIACYPVSEETSVERIVPDFAHREDNSTLNLIFSAPASGSVLVRNGDYHHAQNTASSIWNIEHNMDIQGAIVQCWNHDNYRIYPENIQKINSNKHTVTFSEAVSGHATLIAFERDFRESGVLPSAGYWKIGNGAMDGFDPFSANDLNSWTTSGNLSEISDTDVGIDGYHLIKFSVPKSNAYNINELGIFDLSSNMLYYTRCSDLYKPDDVQLDLVYRIEKQKQES